jgi:3-oxoacyl-[acyl-carrier-protein] synthase II
MIAVPGIGWIEPGGHGAVRTGVRVNAAPRKEEVFLRPVKNFGRLDAVSRMTCLAVGLALKDSGLTYPLGRDGEAGIVGANAAGCLEADMSYFRDYLQGGRTLGRGNLFIYTLPTSPLAEAAIHFALTGALFYVTGDGSPLALAVSEAAGIIRTGGASIMLAGRADTRSALYLALADKSACPREPLCGISEAEDIVRKDLGISGTIGEFEGIIGNEGAEAAGASL